MMLIPRIDADRSKEAAATGTTRMPDSNGLRIPPELQYRPGQETAGSTGSDRGSDRKTRASRESRDIRDAHEAARLMAMAGVVNQARRQYRVFDLYRNADGEFAALPPPARDTDPPEGWEGISRHILHNDNIWEVLEPIPSRGKEDE